VKEVKIGDTRNTHSNFVGKPLGNDQLEDGKEDMKITLQWTLWK
jgi:hypothetical protein